jgi:hypothetical protein
MKFLLDKKQDEHYYNADKNNEEWEFTEVTGSNNNYSFKCTTSIFKGYRMLNRNDINLKFILSKENSIEYYKHS